MGPSLTVPFSPPHPLALLQSAWAKVGRIRSRSSGEMSDGDLLYAPVS